MRYERNSAVVYRSGFVVTITVLITSVWVLGAVATVLRGGEGTAIFVPLGLAVVPWVAYGMLRPRVVLRESEAQVYGYVFHETVPFDSITDALFTGEFLGYRWLEIHQAGGWSVGVHPYMAAAMPFVDPQWQRPLAAELTKLAEQARLNEAGG